MAEWLGKGLQNLVQRFESASDLTETALQISVTLFSFEFVRHLYGNYDSGAILKVFLFVILVIQTTLLHSHIKNPLALRTYSRIS